MNLPKKFFLDQHGCAKNQVDGELIVTRLLNKGLVQTFEPNEADFIIINSCGFIESAKKESLDALYFAKKSYSKAKVVLAGCLAERYSELFKENLPEADAIFGNGDISKLDEIFESLDRNERPVEIYKQQGVCCGERKVLLGYRGTAFVKITEGCSNHCSFCAIPLIRGENRSRNSQEIIREIKNLISQGVVEINLIGQDLAAYGTGIGDNVFGDGTFPLPKMTAICGENSVSGRSALSRLLEEISKISGDFRVRLLYIHPDHFNEDIFPVMQKDKRLLPYFDIPFQSGDDSIILSMNRKGNASLYEKLIAEIRAKLPGAVIRTTFLTGFPGETDENAENTVRFLEKIRSDWSGCFPYSREEDTPAYNFKKRVSSKIAKERAQRLTEIQQIITRESLSKYTGTEIEVLIEEIVEGDEGIAIGRAWFQAPDVDGNIVVRYDRDNSEENNAVKTGKIVRVKVTSSSDVDLDSVFLSVLNQKDGINEDLQYATELQG